MSFTNAHFKKYFTVEAISQIKNDFNFTDNTMIEKFILDFEGFYHILKEIPDSVIKGGMAVPFHLKDPTIRRLSTDIDIVTSLSQSEVEDAMKKIGQQTAGMIEIGNPHEPEKPTLSLPLLTYYCKYDSLFSEDQEITIEIIYDHDKSASTKTITSNFNILGFELDFPITVYDQGSLIGDKLTTFAFNTVGLKGRRTSNIPKQIYDVSKLIRLLQDPLPVEEICNSIENTSQHQLSYIQSPNFNFQDILKDLEVFDQKLLLQKNGFILNPTESGRHKQFANQLLGNTEYGSNDHVSDILLIKYVIMLFKKKFDQTMTSQNIHSTLNVVLQKLPQIESMVLQDRKSLFGEILEKHGGRKSEHGKIIRDLFVDQAFLYDKILELN